MELFDLTGKTAIITGSSRGIGEATAVRMAEHGANVVVSSRKAEACDKVTEAINSRHPGRAITVPAHIGDKEALQNLVDETEKAFGRIDILVCNAAVNPYFGPAGDCPDEAFDKVMDCNVKSNHWLMNMVIPGMTERRDGSIIIISSIAGQLGQRAIGVYGLSKAADSALARNMAVEHGGQNIRTNAIAPGLVKTHFAKALWDDPEILEVSTSTTPMKRIGTPDEIAGAAVFLASPAGSFVNGQTITIDGGQVVNGL